MPDFSEIETLRARQPKPEVMAAHERMRHTVALRMETLLTSDPWETFRAHLEGLQAADESARDLTQLRIQQGEVVGDALLKIVSDLRYLQGRLDAWRQALNLPMALAMQKGLDTPTGQA